MWLKLWDNLGIKGIFRENWKKNCGVQLGIFSNFSETLRNFFWSLRRVLKMF